MTVALVVGVGEVGTRAARQLVDTPGFATILKVAHALGFKLRAERI